MWTRRIVVAALGALGLASAGCGPNRNEVAAAQRLSSVEQTVAVPAIQRIAMRSFGCGTGSAADITIDGAAKLYGVAPRFEFRGGTGAEPVSQGSYVDPVPVRELDRHLLPESRSGTFDPEVWVDLLDGDGNQMGPAVPLGRCSSGLAAAQVSYPIFSEMRLHPRGLDCDAGDRTELWVQGVMVLPGVRARYSFFDPHDRDQNGDVRFITAAEVEVIQKGYTLEIPLQKIVGAGGDPTIFVNYVDTEGNQLSSPELMGHCGQEIVQPAK
jgi:hypothetical protein